MKVSKRVKVSVFVTCLYTLSQFFAGYDSETVNLFTSDASPSVLSIIIVANYIYLYNGQSRRVLVSEYWYAIGISMLLLHVITYAFMCLMGDFFFALNAFSSTGLLFTVGFMVVATPSFFLILMYRKLGRDEDTSDSDVSAEQKYAGR